MKDLNDIIEKLEGIYKTFGIIGVILVLLLVIGTFILWKFLIKNIEEHAKLSVGKELIEYTKKLEEKIVALNSELQRISNKNIGNDNKEREAILDFIDSYGNWLHGTLGTQTFSRVHNINDINKAINRINKAYCKTNEKLNKMLFWTSESNIITPAIKLQKEILKYSNRHEVILAHLRRNIEYIDNEDIAMDLLLNDKDNKPFIDLLPELIKESNPGTLSHMINSRIISKFYNTASEQYITVETENKTFQNITREYLYISHQK
ncbi:hypothetical protein [Marinifilum fragile]|uniref:hypothetical protein n=1 Tax=Marinifilum fragile TaxID=570161 RepID=UPI002AAABF21|nr:hypothetical protein [Marinifilum fragile]